MRTSQMMVMGVAFACLVALSCHADDEEEGQPLTRTEAFISDGKQVTFKVVEEPEVITVPPKGEATFLVYSRKYKAAKEPVGTISLGANTTARLAPLEIDLGEKGGRTLILSNSESRGGTSRREVAGPILQLKSGKAAVTKNPKARQPVFRLQTPVVLMTVKGTDLLMEHQEDRTRVGVLEGSVTLSFDRGPTRLPKGKMFSGSEKGKGRDRNIEAISEEFLEGFSEFRYQPTGVRWLVDDAESPERAAMYFPEKSVRYVEAEKGSVIELDFPGHAWGHDGGKSYCLQFGKSSRCRRAKANELGAWAVPRTWIADLSPYEHVAFWARCDGKPMVCYLELYGLETHFCACAPFRVGPNWQYVRLDLAKMKLVEGKGVSKSSLRELFRNIDRISKIEALGFVYIGASPQKLYLDDFSFYREKPQLLREK